MGKQVEQVEDSILEKWDQDHQDLYAARREVRRLEEKISRQTVSGTFVIECCYSCCPVRGIVRDWHIPAGWVKQDPHAVLVDDGCITDMLCPEHVCDAEKEE
ncbi:MAG: hypothetical protein WCG48_02740 [Candidatus Berkelbacteria bacterium]